MDDRGALVRVIRQQQQGCRTLGGAFYAALCDLFAADVEQEGPVADVLAPFAQATFQDAYVLRLLGGIHRAVLEGDAPTLARHYPSADGGGDPHRAMAAIRDLLTTRPRQVFEALSRPPQTNEVGRSAGARIRSPGDRRAPPDAPAPP